MAIPSPYDIAMRRLRENAKQTGIYQGLVKPFVDLSDAMEDPSAYVVQDPESTQYGRLNSAGMGMAGGLANAGMMGAGVQSGPGLGMGARLPGPGAAAEGMMARAGRAADDLGPPREYIGAANEMRPTAQVREPLRLPPPDAASPGSAPIHWQSPSPRPGPVSAPPGPVKSPYTEPALTGALLTAGGGVGMSLADRAMEGHARESAKRASAQQKPSDGVQSPWPEYGPPMSAMGQMPSKGKPRAGAGAGGFSTGLAGSSASAQPVGGMAGAQGAPADGGPDARRVGPDHYEVIQRSQDMGDEYARVFAHAKREARKQAFASAQGGGPNFSVMRDPAYNRVYLLTAGGDEFEFDLGKPSDQQEFARMARHTGMSPDQLMAAAEMAGRPLYDVYSPMRSPESMQTAGRFDPRQILNNPPQDPNVAKAMLDRMF